jgi:hypothetical protein
MMGITGCDHRNDSLQALVFFPQGFPRFDVLRVQRNAGHGADLHALRLVEMAHAFGAFVRVDLVNFLAQVDRLVGAFGLADVAVDAFVGDHQAMFSPLSPLRCAAARADATAGLTIWPRRRPAC